MEIAFVVARAATWSALFIGFVLVFLPARMLAESGVVRPATIGIAQAAGAVVTVLGAVAAFWCIATFAFVGRGTPAPFDPPRRLVVRGPYRFVRNPMYLGAALALAGAALFYGSARLALYAAGFLLAMHAFVIAYEEPALRSAFGDEYDAYCRSVRRWRLWFPVRSHRVPPAS